MCNENRVPDLPATCGRFVHSVALLLYFLTDFQVIIIIIIIIILLVLLMYHCSMETY